MMRFVGMRTGGRLPALGLGTWKMGEEPHRRAAEVAALKLGLDLGVTLIDTAELYANGAAEEIVAEALPGGGKVVANQVLYNLERRGIERGLLPWCAESGVVVMAYSPLDEGKLRVRPALTRVGARHGVTPHTVAIAWTLRVPGVITLPKATHPDHVRDCVKAAALTLDPADLAELDAAYPAPARDIPLETA